MNQQPFTARFHLIHSLAGQRSIVVKAREHWISRSKNGDRFTDQCAAHCSRGSKDGIAFRHELLHLALNRFACGKGQWNAPQVHPQRPGMKARIHQEPRHRMRRYRLAVDGGDEHALVACSAQPLLPRKHRKCASPDAACVRSGSSAGRNTSRFGFPRLSHATNCPLRKITSA